jgi:hypothetical protein
MTLGCGGPGGNITSDNITPRHLLNIKRLAYEIRPAVVTSAGAARPFSASATVGSRSDPTGSAGWAIRESGSPPARPRTADLPQPPGRPIPEGIPAEALAARIDQFLASRGLEPQKPRPVRAELPEAPADFVCEDDVRDAIRSGRKVLIGEKTILTPSARDLGESQKVFVQADWPR